ncbi:MAG: methyltransferase domain-containing protein [Pirellulales bacterium]
MTPTIAILDDFLRDEPNGLEHHVANRRWLAAMARSLAGQTFAVRELGFDCGGDDHLDVSACMASLGLDCGVAGWAAAWDGQPSDRFVGFLGERLRGVDVVMGFGLSNLVATAVDRLELPFIDVEVSPFRFQPDLDIDARTNSRPLAESPLFAVPEARLRAAATAVRGWCARHASDVIPVDVGRVGVVFGQTEIDASLIDAGRLDDFPAHAVAVREWAEGLDHILFRPHPYAATATAFEHLYEILPTIRPTRIGSYPLLASGRVDRFLALSSGIIDEAAYFDMSHRSTRLFLPKRRTGGFHYAPVVSLDSLSATVLAAVLERRPIPAVGPHSYALRQQFAITWGLPLEVVATDFFTPEPLVVAEPAPATEPPLAIETSTPPPGEVLPPVEPGPAPVVEPPPRRLTLGRKVAREAARLVAQVGRILGGPDQAEPQDAQCAGVNGESQLPRVDGPADAVKDFGYLSGERQTGLFYFEIRRDHRARYELAARTVPRGSRVLDLFCGNGYGSFLLSDRHRVLGIDGSTEAIAVARQHYARLGARFEARQFPFEDDTRYDAVVSYESLEHVDDGPGFYRFLIDRVVPGGLLLVSTPNQDLLPFDATVHVHHRRHYGLAETLALAETCGLTIRTWYGQDVYRLEGSAAPAPLHPAKMELRERQPGQFTVVVAEKPRG